MEYVMIPDSGSIILIWVEGQDSGRVGEFRNEELARKHARTIGWPIRWVRAEEVAD